MGQIAVSRLAMFAATTAIGGGLALAVDKAWEIFKKKPERPPRPPPENLGISEDDLVSNAQIKLKMDIINDYNYAVCGPRGTGKSTFINCIRDLEDPDLKDNVSIHHRENAAPVGITDTTDEILGYKFPKDRSELQHVVIWDMPGSGTKTHPIESYFTDKVLYAFDCLLITSESIFGEMQIKILDDAQKYNTPVVIVITQLEHAIDNKVKAQFKQQRHYHLTLDEYRSIVEDAINELKSYAVSQQKIVPRSRIFVVSAHKLRDFFKSTDARNWNDADEDELLSGEMKNLIQFLADEAHHRRF